MYRIIVYQGHGKGKPLTTLKKYLLFCSHKSYIVLEYCLCPSYIVAIFKNKAAVAFLLFQNSGNVSISIES